MDVVVSRLEQCQESSKELKILTKKREKIVKRLQEKIDKPKDVTLRDFISNVKDKNRRSVRSWLQL